MSFCNRSCPHVLAVAMVSSFLSFIRPPQILPFLFVAANPSQKRQILRPRHINRHSPKLAASKLEEDSEQNQSSSQQKSKYTIQRTIRSTQTDVIPQIHTSSTEQTSILSLDPQTRNSFILLLASQFILFLGVGAVIPVIPLYSQSIGLSSASNGVVVSAPAVALLLCSRNSAQIADVRRKPAMMAGMAIIAISDLATGFASSLWTLVVARLGLGLGRGYAEAGERGMLADLANQAPNSWRGRGLALQQACIAIGIAIGASGGGMLVEKYGVRSGFLCVSVAAVICLGLYALLPETVVRYDDPGGKISNNKHSEDSNQTGWIQLLATSATWRSLALCQCGTSFGYACKIAIVPVLATEYLPGGVSAAGLLLSATGLAGLVGASLGGYVTDRFGSRFAATSTGVLSGLSFIMIPFGLSLVGNKDSLPLLHEPQNVFLHFGLGPTLFVLFVILWSIGASAQAPALAAFAQQQAPVGREATALGLPRAFGDGAYILAPLILGHVSDAVGEIIPGAACAVAGLVICIGSVVLVLVPPKVVPDQ